MIAWINFAVLLFSSFFLLFFYVRSVNPAGRETVIGLRAYQLCFYDRLTSAAFEFVITINYILYYFYPLDTPLPDSFPWRWWISLVIATIIGVPALILLIIGIRDAGLETMRPKKEQVLFGGIYAHLRHPQAVGEVFLFLVIALLLNSPFLTFFSLIYFPLFMIMCFAEEQDLLLRYGKAYADYCKRTGPFLPMKQSKRKNN